MGRGLIGGIIRDIERAGRAAEREQVRPAVDEFLWRHPGDVAGTWSNE